MAWPLGINTWSINIFLMLVQYHQYPPSSQPILSIATAFIFTIISYQLVDSSNIVAHIADLLVNTALTTLWPKGVDKEIVNYG